MKNRPRPVHPGEILRQEYLARHGTSASALARAILVPPNRVTEIIAGARSITADTALRLARHLHTTPEFWMSLQQAYELRVAEANPASASELRRIKPLSTVDEDCCKRHHAEPKKVV